MSFAELLVIDKEFPSSIYSCVDLSTTIKDASAGTDTVETIGYAVPPAGAEP